MENVSSNSSSSSYCSDSHQRDHEGMTAHRHLRSSYRSVQSRITNERDDISRPDSDKFNIIINQLDSLHQQVKRPKEQVADLETLLDITSTLLTSIQAQNKEGITVSDFLSSLLQHWGQQSGASCSREDDRTSIAWTDIGVAVSDVFRTNHGFSTMIGPMNRKIKQRKAAVSRKRPRPIENAQLEELDDTLAKEKMGTDKNMLTMFNILRKNRKARLENLVLNRKSFAQTVENLFALSFLVKDGRAEIKVEDRDHFVYPRNAPTANAIASGKTSYSHFMFRFDFQDWKLMTSMIEAGAELMPHRNEENVN